MPKGDGWGWRVHDMGVGVSLFWSNGKSRMHDPIDNTIYVDIDQLREVLGEMLDGTYKPIVKDTGHE